MTELAEAFTTVREALAHLKALEKLACNGRYYFAKGSGQALKIIEDNLMPDTAAQKSTHDPKCECDKCLPEYAGLAKPQTTCKYMPSKSEIKLAQTVLSEATFRYFSRWAMDDSGYEIVREDNRDAPIPCDENQEWMVIKRCIPESDLADEWCEIFTLAEHIKLAETA